MQNTIHTFTSRLPTLRHLIGRAQAHFGSDDFLNLRLIDDMHPLSTQIVFTCNQPHNFAQWIEGEPVTTLDTDIQSASETLALIDQVNASIARVADNASDLPDAITLEFGPTRYAELTGPEYIQDFLIPNFYFHLVTSYDILRANGVAVGKADYMAHLLGKVRERSEN